jgi:hypothetical protein
VSQAGKAGKPIRVTVGLVQTDIMVFDRQGHFVPDLKKDQFELRVDGKVQPISFFEMVSAGSPHDEQIWAMARKNSAPMTEPSVAKSANPGRTLLFFVDDWHLSAESCIRSRMALENLIRTSVGPDDRVAVFAASGQLGLTRQLTNAAARAGIVIYSLDTRGLVVGLPEAAKKRGPDIKGYLAHSGYSEVLPQQDALNALAADTGGRFLKNTNALDTAMITTMTEISRYYLLAWSINPEQLQPGKYSTIKASIKGRSDLNVRIRQGSLDLSQLVSRKRPDP